MCSSWIGSNRFFLFEFNFSYVYPLLFSLFSQIQNPVLPQSVISLDKRALQPKQQSKANAQNKTAQQQTAPQSQPQSQQSQQQPQAAAVATTTPIVAAAVQQTQQQKGK